MNNDKKTQVETEIQTNEEMGKTEEVIVEISGKRGLRSGVRAGLRAERIIVIAE